VNDVAGLATLLGDRLVTHPDVLRQHGTDESYHAPQPPDAVAYPQTIDEIAVIVSECARSATPIIPFGAGTSLEGHVAASRGGVCIDLSRMNRVLEVRPDDMDADVQPGVTKNQLNAALRDHGLFFPVDPGSDATIGGMAATRASGTTTVRYGTIRENVLSMRVVLADGRIIRPSSRARKSAAGYDLTHLFIGSEGTLGIIGELTVRVVGVPEAIAAARCMFPSVEAAVRSVMETIQIGIPVTRIELLDEVQIDAVNRYSGRDYPVAPTLFYEFHGSERGVAENAESASGIAADNGGSSFDWATGQKEGAKLWDARHDAYYAALAVRPGSRGFATDVCVPISRLAECIVATQEDLRASGLVAPIVGHVGDGNFHLIFCVSEDAGELARVEALNDRLVRRALAMGGTCTGEHGVGYGKARYMREEHGDAMDVMAAIKRALDPAGILNPGKILYPFRPNK